eukprot:418529-Pyramimonas_sp.AAC.1
MPVARAKRPAWALMVVALTKFIIREHALGLASLCQLLAPLLPHRNRMVLIVLLASAVGIFRLSSDPSIRTNPASVLSCLISVLCSVSPRSLGSRSLTVARVISYTSRAKFGHTKFLAASASLLLQVAISFLSLASFSAAGHSMNVWRWSWSHHSIARVRREGQLPVPQPPPRS